MGLCTILRCAHQSLSHNLIQTESTIGFDHWPSRSKVSLCLGQHKKCHNVVTGCIFSKLVCLQHEPYEIITFFSPCKNFSALGLVSCQQHVFIYWMRSRSIAQISTPRHPKCVMLNPYGDGGELEWNDPVKCSLWCTKACWSIISHPSIFRPASISSLWNETSLYGMNKRIRWEEHSSCKGVSKWVCRFVSEGQRF